MRKFIIMNTNKERHCFFDDDRLPHWLDGDYVLTSHGEMTDDLARAHFYDDRERAERQAVQLEGRYGVGGTIFEVGRSRYPDSCGKNGYATFAPTYKVVPIEVSVKIVKE